MSKCRARAALALGVLLLRANAAGAQRTMSTTMPQSELASFLRVAETVMQPVNSLARLWPLSRLSAAPQTLELTPAHRVTVALSPRLLPNDSTTRVQLVSYTELLPDTIALMQRVLAVGMQLQSRFGDASRCSSLSQAPSYLFAPQTVTEAWGAGPAGAPMQLQWSVTPDRRYFLTVTVGAPIDTQLVPLVCGTPMP